MVVILMSCSDNSPDGYPDDSPDGYSDRYPEGFC